MTDVNLTTYVTGLIDIICLCAIMQIMQGISSSQKLLGKLVGFIKIVPVIS